jgi:hypothetical protein
MGATGCGTEGLACGEPSFEEPLRRNRKTIGYFRLAIENLQDLTARQAAIFALRSADGVKFNAAVTCSTRRADDV